DSARRSAICMTMEQCRVHACSGRPAEVFFCGSESGLTVHIARNQSSTTHYTDGHRWLDREGGLQSSIRETRVIRGANFGFWIELRGDTRHSQGKVATCEPVGDQKFAICTIGTARCAGGEPIGGRGSVRAVYRSTRSVHGAEGPAPSI